MLNAQQMENYLTRGVQHYELEEYELAIDYFHQVLLFAEKPKMVYSYLASSYLLTGNADRSINIAEKGLKKHPDFLRLQLIKGEAKIQIAPSRAITVFENIYKAAGQTNEYQPDDINKQAIAIYLGQLHQQQGGNAFEEGHLEKATKHFRQARNYTPDSLSVHNNLAYLYIQQEKWKKAEKTVQTGLKHFPGDDNLLFMRAQVLENQGDSEQMVEALKQFYQSKPSDLNRAVLYGRALLNNHEARKANSFFQQKINEYPNERILYRTLIDINRQRFNLSGLVEILQIKLEQFPEDRDLLEEYGRELINAGQYKMANSFFDSLATEYNSPEYARIAAKTWLYEDQYEEARKQYEKYLKIWPEDVHLTGDLAIVLKKTGADEESTKAFEKYLDQRENSRMRIQYASLLTNTEVRKNAVKPLYHSKYAGLARWMVLKNLDNTEESTDTEYFTQILADILELYKIRNDEVTSEAKSGLESLQVQAPPLFQSSTELKEINEELQAILNYIRDDLSFDDALEILDKTVKEFDNSALINHHRGLLYYRNQKEPEVALKNFEKAVRLDANSEESHLYLGHLYKKLERFDQAILSYERVLTLNNENREAYRMLIRVSQKSGNLDQLCERWLQRYRNQRDNEVLKDFIIDALHRADRFEEAREITSQ